VIARYGSGHDNIDVERAAARGIAVTNVPDYSTEEVADHTVALRLAAARCLTVYAASVRRGGWTPRPLPPVKRMRGRTLALLGCGRIGRAVADRMHAFRTEIVAYDPAIPSLPDGVQRAGSIDELVAGADFLSLHAPLTAQTRGCINGQRAALARGAVIVNVARGGLLDLAAATHALESGHLAALALDVVDEEPLPERHPLRSMKQAIVTPHVAYFSHASVEEAKRRSVAEILAVPDGRPPLHPVASTVADPASAR
jgi:D-3-phosphoglycerate dehydrogenase